MQLFLSSYVTSTTLLLLLTLFISPWNNNNFVTAQERMVRFLFNNGNPPASWQTCTWQDNVLIDDIFRYRYNRRYLRNNIDDNNSNNTVVDDDETMASLTRNHSWAASHDILASNNETAVVSQQQRDLNTFPRYCRNNCAGYAQGVCRATNCIGYRRRELKNDEGNNSKHQNNDRRALQVASCNTVMTAIQNKINDLVWNNRVSATCKSYLTAPIIKNCTDDVVYGVLEGVRIWDVGNPWAPTQMFYLNANSMPNSGGAMPASSFSFCRSRRITIEAVMNPCVMVTSFHMYYNFDWWNPFYINNQQTSRPFSLYGNNANGQMNGIQWLNAGTYYVDIKPDWWIWKEKRIVFTVNNC